MVEDYKDKICPLKRIGAKEATRIDCDGKSCAWWVDYQPPCEPKCAITEIALALVGIEERLP